MIQAKIHGVVLDPINKGFAVILTDNENKKWLPIYVGPFEAQAIAMELENTKPPRPLTHDLMKNILDSLNVKISRISIIDLRDNTFYATISLEENGLHREIDARPSDAIALALRTKSPIFVSEEVLNKAGLQSAPKEDEKTKKMRELQTKLMESIEKENYEAAAKIRDEIKKTKEELPKKNQPPAE